MCGWSRVMVIFPLSCSRNLFLPITSLPLLEILTIFALMQESRESCLEMDGKTSKVPKPCDWTLHILKLWYLWEPPFHPFCAKYVFHWLRLSAIDRDPFACFDLLDSFRPHIWAMGFESFRSSMQLFHTFACMAHWNLVCHQLNRVSLDGDGKVLNVLCVTLAQLQPSQMLLW